VKKATIRSIVLLIGALLAFYVPTYVSAHITGGETKISGKYRIQFLILPKNPLPNENVTLNFSIQDLASNNLSNVTATITIEQANATVFLAPVKTYVSGDFLLMFVFPQEGNYVLTVIVLDGQQGFPATFNITVSRLNRELSEINQRLPYLLWIGVLLGLSVLLVRELRESNARSRKNAKYRPLKRAHFRFFPRCLPNYPKTYCNHH
jgi:hypothetical protein